MNPQKRLPLIWVQWWDAYTNSDDVEAKDTDAIDRLGRCIRQSAGLLVRDTDEGVTMATDWTDIDQTWSDLHFIPRPMIKSMKRFG